jgi:transposase
MADVANHLPPRAAVYQQTQRWIAAGSFETMVHDLRTFVRWTEECADDPSAVILNARTVQRTPVRGAGAGDDGCKRRNGRKTHIAVNTLGYLLALHVTPANAQERDQVGVLSAAVQVVTGETVEIAYGGEGEPGPTTAADAVTHGIRLEVMKIPGAKRGFVLLPRRWVVKRSLAWAARVRRLARDDERLPETVAGLHVIAFACLMLQRLLTVAVHSP